MSFTSQGHRPHFGQSHEGQRHAAQIADALIREPPVSGAKLLKRGQGRNGVLICAQADGETITFDAARKLNRPKSSICKDCGNRCL